jgi:hypothetical protein
MKASCSAPLKASTSPSPHSLRMYGSKLDFKSEGGFDGARLRLCLGIMGYTVKMVPNGCARVSAGTRHMLDTHLGVAEGVHVVNTALLVFSRRQAPRPGHLSDHRHLYRNG